MGHFHHQHLCVGTIDMSCHRKRGSIFTPNPNMVNPKSQHHQPSILPPKVSRKLTSLNTILNIPWLQISLLLSSPLSNANIALQHRTQYLQNIHAKTCEHYSHHCFFRSSFQIFLSTPSYRTYETSEGSDTSP